MVIEKIRGDYDLEIGEHKQRLENKCNTLPFEHIRPGEAMEELFLRIRELVVSLSHYGVEKSFPGIIGMFFKNEIYEIPKRILEMLLKVWY